jgi:hypothetical protein
MIMAPMMPPRDGDHERFDQAGERFGGRLDLGVVEVRDLVQHRVDRAGVLADGEHLHDHRREHRVLGQRPGERFAPAHALLHRGRGPAQHHVAAGLPYDLQALQDRHPALSMVPRLRLNRLIATFW